MSSSCPSHASSISALEAEVEEKSEEVSGEETEDEPEKEKLEKEKFRPGWRFHTIFGCLCLMMLVVALDATTLSVALPVISSSLHGTALTTFWAGTSFLLSSTVFQPTLSSLSHIFGRLPLILFSLVVFTAGCITAALSASFTVLILGRTVQGVGAGGLIVLSEVVITDLVPLRERGSFYGYMSATWAVGSVCGPLVGGVFAGSKSAHEMNGGEKGGYGGWRWIFWLNIPIAVVGLVILPVVLRLQKPMHGFSVKEKLKSVDWIGAVLLTGSTTAILMPVTWGGIQYSWSNFRTLLPLLLGLIGFVGWIAYEIYTQHPNPLIKMQIFSNRTAAASYFGILIQGIILWCLLYYLPLYYEACHSLSPLRAGLAILPETLTVAPVAFIAGIAISKVGVYRWCIWLGWSLAILGLGVMWLLDENTSTKMWVGINLIPGIGIGLLFPGLEYATQAAAGQKDVADAAAMYNFIRAFGQGIGVAVGGSIFQTQLKRKLLAFPAVAGVATKYANDAASLIELMKAMDMEDRNGVREALEKGYADSLKMVWAVMASLAGLALLVSLFTRELGIDEELESKQGLKRTPGQWEDKAEV
ncbi:MFS general substrate transporter [Lindgomyces ingoldianus]|uniref:MFS general substrate transporter n=1 Tax=Lindgomyces ingoldianus TaxID=673940 RepID=A0ACB6QSX5_9PLEO|nr:MFS general substrate transporter [Lindgomyces ingoldianus]KAF2469991.1 MFS general substrate transporter [Lindgomyces ingoldianus]